MLTYFESIFRGSGDTFKVLVIDDSSTVRAIYRSNLKKIKNTIVANCENAEEAIEICKTEDFDIIIIDYEMPGMNGVDLILALRTLEKFRTVPMIMVTATTDQTVKLNALAAGVNDFLTKPFDPVELRARVSNMLVLSHMCKRLVRETRP